MKGYMRERSGGWELRVYAGRDPVSGRMRYLTRTVRGGIVAVFAPLAVYVYRRST
jgi:hypothetical protein